MRYSLLSRFQGALLGSEGEIASELSPWWEISRQNVIALGRGQQASLAIGQGEDSPGQAYWSWQQSATASEAAIATLPLALFYHDSRQLRGEKLEQAASFWLRPDQSAAAVLVWGQALSLVLRDQFTMAALGGLSASLASAAIPLQVQLELLQAGLQKGTSLTQLAGQVTRLDRGSAPLALALYCFTTTPTDFYLAVRRARRLSSLTAVLVGAIAGANNGWSAIPYGWRRVGNPETWHLAERLFAQWAGTLPCQSLPPEMAIAAPGILQARSSLRIISRED